MSVNEVDAFQRQIEVVGKQLYELKLLARLYVYMYDNLVCGDDGMHLGTSFLSAFLG